MCITGYWSVVVNLFDLKFDWLVVGIIFKQVDSPINRRDAAEISKNINFQNLISTSLKYGHHY